MLKADFHIHTSEDPDDYWIRYSAKELINHASKLGFEVLAITNHCTVTFNEELAGYAKKKGILLIPGIEAVIGNKEIVILNANKEAEKIRTFSELNEFRKKNPSAFVMAPHPFYPKRRCVGKHLSKHNDIFDGVEYCHYYCRGFNLFNKKAVEKAKKYGKSLIGTSDAHMLFQFSNTYSFVDAEKNVNSVIKALRKNKIEIKTKPLSYLNCIRVVIPMMMHGIRNCFVKPK